MENKVLIGSTIASYKVNDFLDESLAWLMHAEEIQQSTRVKFFASIEYDGRGIEHFQPLTERLEELDGTWWSFCLDTNIDVLTLNDRIPRICMGRNLIIEYATMDASITHILFLDSDVEIPGDSLSKLLSLKHEVTGGYIPTYQFLDGPRVPVEGRDIRQHWNTAGFLLMSRDAFRKIRWGWDIQAGLSDDPWTQNNLARLGYHTWVDHELVGQHHPYFLIPLDKRGYDLTIVK